jgi:hypothetical protein
VTAAVTAPEVAFLAQRGWYVAVAPPFDLCWLDCSRDGWLKSWLPRGGGKALCICLCPQHAVLLEEGVWAGDYTGAPLPPDSKADEWPWRYCSEVGVTAS